ncbi:hypothetical protein HY36_00850 [Hyphomonas atlantica]|uniref:Uncharacterized protein n=1 Tax=Hyphomonas atlantica TaxID=1280948 RepID=A0A059EB93_9PROT|nr:hypothetical protein HY36_00850 [Hyphomonas atlantica]
MTRRVVGESRDLMHTLSARIESQCGQIVGNFVELQFSGKIRRLREPLLASPIA